MRAVLRAIVARGTNRAAIVMRNNLTQMFAWARKRQPWRKPPCGPTFHGRAQDLHSEAWIVASEISEKRGREIDFSDPADQSLVMGHVYTKKVLRRDRHLSSAVRIDQEVEGEDGAVKLVAQLKAHSSSDPLKQLVRRENAMEAEAKLRASYSQAAAYFHTFTRFKHDRERVCLHLLISSLVLTRRMNVAEATTLVQPSLFDGKQRITSRFKAEPGRPYVVRVDRHMATAQWRWDFEGKRPAHPPSIADLTCPYSGFQYGDMGWQIWNERRYGRSA